MTTVTSTDLDVDEAADSSERLSQASAVRQDTGEAPHNSLKAKALRSSAFAMGGYAASQVLRLGSNLILTRLLVPEAFGLMALIGVVIQGLTMFSDVGLTPAIIQNKRGDEKPFLDTAWTIQVIRGAVLWAATCLISYPIAQFYQEPRLAYLLPVTGISVFIAGWIPTKVVTANRHLALARLTLVDLISQILTLVSTAMLAWMYANVWALVLGTILGSVIKLALSIVLVQGPLNQFCWESQARHELIHFGKWLFITTMFGFIVDQIDKVILGAKLSPAELGVYGVGSLMGLVPLMLTAAVSSKVLMPVYRLRLPATEAPERRSIFKVKAALNIFHLAACSVLVIAGPEIIAFLYDDRYRDAGAITSLVCACSLARHLCIINDSALLAIGRSRLFAAVIGFSASIQLIASIAGVYLAGIGGVLLATAIGPAFAYCFMVRELKRLGIWFPIWDAGVLVMGIATFVAGFALHGEAIGRLFGT